MAVAEGGLVERTSCVAGTALSAGERDSKVKMMFESHSPTLLPLHPKLGHRLLL